MYAFSCSYLHLHLLKHFKIYYMNILLSITTGQGIGSVVSTLGILSSLVAWMAQILIILLKDFLNKLAIMLAFSFGYS